MIFSVLLKGIIVMHISQYKCLYISFKYSICIKEVNEEEHSKRENHLKSHAATTLTPSMLQSSLLNYQSCVCVLATFAMWSTEITEALRRRDHLIQRGLSYLLACMYVQRVGKIHCPNWSQPYRWPEDFCPYSWRWYHQSWDPCFSEECTAYESDTLSCRRKPSRLCEPDQHQ